MNQHFVARTLERVTLDTADSGQKELLEAVRKQAGFVPNMYAYMANAPGLLTTYQHGYAAFRQHSGFTPAEQEVVFLAISQQNGCHYCMAAHSMVADRISGVSAPVLAAIRTHRPIPDRELDALYAYAQELVRTAGKPSQATGDAFLAAGYSEKQALQIILAAAVKTLSNYTNHFCETAVDDSFAAYKAV